MYTAATIAALVSSTLALSSYAPVASAPAYSAPGTSDAGSYTTVSSAVGAYSSPTSTPASSWVSQTVAYGDSSSSVSAAPSMSYGGSSHQIHPTGYNSSVSYSYPSQPPSASSTYHPGHPGGPVGGWGPPGHAGPPGGSWGPSSGPGATCPGVQPGQYCLSYEDSEEAADVFRELIQNYSDAVALEYLTEDFVDYSSSVAIIINGGDGEPLDIEKPVFVGRAAFMSAQGSQPEIPFKKLQRFHGCNSVSMRWLTRRSANGQETETARIPVVGNVIIETVQSNPGDAHNFRIKSIFSEFNSAAWLVNLGVFVPENGTEGEAGNKRSLPVDLRGAMI